MILVPSMISAEKVIDRNIASSQTKPLTSTLILLNYEKKVL